MAAAWGRWLALVALAALCLQLVFAARVATMTVVDPGSSTFQRSQAVRILQARGRLPWHQEWQPIGQMGPHLPRAVMASEDAAFWTHRGLDWNALDRAWTQQQRRSNAKVVGGSTISQQLAKNLFLSGERTMWRKGQELLITAMMEALWSKTRLLEIYLNHVEWGEGVYGATAASRHYFRTDPQRLTPQQAAQLAVMLPAPRRFEKNPHSAYVLGRAEVIRSRMAAVPWPQPPEPAAPKSTPRP